jgi:hypothetical protein
MIIDCDRCTLRGPACANCAVTFITSDLITSDLNAGDIFAAGRESPRGPESPGRPESPGGHEGRGGREGRGGPEGHGGRMAGHSVTSGAVVGHGAELDATELRALTVLANAGMIPPLRYAPAMAKASLRAVIGHQ